jgi:hypothetical protein
VVWCGFGKVHQTRRAVGVASTHTQRQQGGVNIDDADYLLGAAAWWDKVFYYFNRKKNNKRKAYNIKEHIFMKYG